MREILFRGKREDNGKWVYGCVNVMQNGNTYIFRYSQQFEVDPSTVGQFTGLTDKNGKKIFEGDILKFLNPKPFRDFIAKVAFNDGCFDLVNDSRDFRDYLKCYTCNYAGEVIGNIYDNPELLGESHEHH